MQVGVDVKCMHTSFGGHDLSGFGDIVHGHQKILLIRIGSKNLCK